MKRASFFLILICFLASPSLFGQDNQANAPKATIKINGTGHLRITPDLAVVNMTVKTTDMNFNRAVKKLNEKTDHLNKKLQAAGFKKEEIKTSQLNVHENGQWRNGNYVDSGYVATQYIELRFKRDQQRMSKLMEAFAKDKGAEALFQFGFALSDEAKQQANEELIRKAIKDAKSKADIIATASGIQLGNIRNILYGQPESPQYPMHKMEMMQMSAREASDQAMPEIEVRELEMQDTITILWEIL